LKSSTTPAIQPALLIQAAWRKTAAVKSLAQASDESRLRHSRLFLCPNGVRPAIPGNAILFKLTVTNVTNAAQYLSVGYHVPQFTTATTTGYLAWTALHERSHETATSW
jgi:hypothetical protein